MKGIAFAEHGNVFSWINKKQKCDKEGIKYIHAQEFYITNSLEEKIRDNYHTILIARNWEGVKELNKLSSIGYHKEDGHFYYDPRISIDELINTSDNILITSACLASPLYKGKNELIYNKYLKFFIENKHRCFLEIQYHNIEQQKEYNLQLLELHKKYNIPIIAGTDTHALNSDYMEVRKKLLQSKKIKYADEDTFDLSFKSYNELVNKFKIQNTLPEKIYLQAIENTNLLLELVEDFELDKSHKYPRLYDNAEEMFKQKVNEGVVKRGFDKYEKEKRKQYYNRIKEEYDIYKKCDAIDYMLLQENIISWARNKGIYQGPGRGSVTGSEISYALHITDMDSIKFNLNFFRFMNPDRISLADIDIDFPSTRRHEVIDYVATMPGIYFSEIITFNTVADKGAIREVGRSLDMLLSEVDEIAKNYEGNEEYYRNNYSELFKYVDLLKGTNVSVGSHPSGFLVSPIPINENIGYFYTSESKYPVCQCNMKEIDSLNYVKLDILGLDNIDIINETCKLANIERLTPDNVDFEDDEVWEEIKNSPLGIFQFESKFAHDTLVKVLNLVDDIRKRQPDVQRLDLMSMVNGAIRPSGESFREDLCNGIIKDNGHEALNEFLSPTMRCLIYQEQIMMFLVKFCGFSMSEADNVRRLIGKKLGTENIIAEIRDRFIDTMHKEYDVPNDKLEEIVEPFLKIILDASSYGFSVNHSQPYSTIGYMCGKLRHYYPLEFTTVILNINEDRIEKTGEIIKYAMTKGINICPIKFRKSQAKYSMEKETNSIYKGIESIKFLNEKIAEELYELRNNKYETFTDFLVHAKENTSVNTRQMQILIKLNYFDEFYKNKKLLQIHEKFEKRYKKTHKDKTKTVRIEEIKEFELNTPNESININEQIIEEKTNLGYAQTKIDNLEYNIAIVLDVNLKYTPKLNIYSLNEGVEKEYKIYKKTFKNKSLEVGDIVLITDEKLRPRMRKTESGFEETGEKESYITDYTKVNIEKLNKYLHENNITY